jgi:hypothetical protein
MIECLPLEEALMYWTHGGTRPEPDVKADMLKTLAALSNYIVTDASDSEMFTLSVAREIFANTPKHEIEKAIRKLQQPATDE